MSEGREVSTTRRLTLAAMLAAMAYAAMLITRPLPKVSGFLSYDLKDVVVALAGFLLGPVQALLITAVVSLLEMVTVSGTGPIGLIMNILSTSAFVLPAALVYRRRRTLSGAAVGMVSGVLLMTATMLLWNYLITPLYMNVPRSVVAGMLLTTFLPFNLIKGGLNAGITMLLYKPLAGALRRAHLLPAQSGADVKPHNWTAAVISAAVAVACIVFLVLMMNK